MTRPMSEEERAMVIAEARETLRRWQFIGVGVEPDSVRVARALLSTSSAERGMREALERVDHTLTVHGKVDSDTDLHAFIRATLKDAALSPKGEG